MRPVPTADVAEVAVWSEEAGFHGILVYTDNSLVDPWLVAQLILQETRSLSPLVAVQPVYMHPYVAAKMIASLAFLHGRRVDVNLVTGGFRKDLLALADETPHDERYERLVEYGEVMRGLLTTPRPYSFEGAYHRVSNLQLRPAVPAELRPSFFVSGSSPAGLAAARALGATAVKYPQPAHEELSGSDPDAGGLGIRVGIVARETDEEAWRVAHERFPGDRKGQLTHQLAMEVTDSHWHHQLSRRQLSRRQNGSEPTPDPYWLWPFQNYHTFCPYLVGSHNRVGRELRAYKDSGFTTLIVDIPASPADLEHIGIALDRTLAPVDDVIGDHVTGDDVTGTLHERVAEQAARMPDSTAVVLGDESLTYAELDAESNRLARCLLELGCERGDRVCLFLPKSPAAIVAMLGTLKAGCAYVPVDLESPGPRLARIVARADPRVAIVAREASARLDEVRAAGGLEDGVRIGSLSADGEAGRAFDAAAIVAISAEPVASRAGGADAAHILFTSGSTGEPKGVVITHSNVLAFLAWAIPYFGIGTDDRVSGHPPLHFDLSTFDIYGALITGAQLHLVPPSLNLPPRGIARFIEEQGLTQWFSVPSVLTYMAKFDAVPEGGFPTLHRVLSCGDVLSIPVLEHWAERLPHVRFTNLYGPTEATIASSVHSVDAISPGDASAIPIGTACAGEELLVLDEELKPGAPDSPGDLYIGGAGLSPGYWRDEEKTRAAFVPDPRPDCSGRRLYRTGDRARIDEDGLAHFLGRADSQVKSRGYRIELGEVERAVNGLPEVREAAVVGIESEFEGTALCCAFAPSDSGADSEGDADAARHLKQALRATLPAYMLPSRWLALPALPKNANGKIDRSEIKRLFDAKPAEPARR